MGGFYGSRKDYRRTAPRILDYEGPDRTAELWVWLVGLASLTILIWALARLLGWA